MSCSACTTSRAFGPRLTVQKLRTLIDGDPVLRGMLPRVGRVFALPAASLPAVLQRLRTGPTAPRA